MRWKSHVRFGGRRRGNHRPKRPARRLAVDPTSRVVAGSGARATLGRACGRSGEPPRAVGLRLPLPMTACVRAAASAARRLRLRGTDIGADWAQARLGRARFVAAVAPAPALAQLPACAL
jgi:hypothetical protein